MTMNEFGKLFNKSRSVISMWENSNIIPHANMLILISKKFNISIDYLLGNDDLKEV